MINKIAWIFLNFFFKKSYLFDTKSYSLFLKWWCVFSYFRQGIEEVNELGFNIYILK